MLRVVKTRPGIVMFNHPVIKKIGGSSMLVIVPRVTHFNVIIVIKTTRSKGELLYYEFMI